MNIVILEHCVASDAVLDSAMIIRLVTRAVVGVVVPFGVSKAGYLSGCPGELGQVVQGSYLDA